MRAVLVDEYTSVDLLRLRDIASPAMARDQVRVRVQAVGIGFVDALKIAGRYQTKDPLPFVPGMEFAGIIDEIGGDVVGSRLGDRVFGSASRGALAEQICVAAAGLSKIPDPMSFAGAAAVPVNYLTAAYGLIELAGLRPGQNLLVLGAAGGTGTAAMNIGRMIGARVIAGAASEAKRAFVLAHGADLAVDYTAEDWRKSLAEMTGGKPMDVIFDAVGGDISPIAFRTLGWRGKHLVVGFAAGKISSLPLNIALLKGASLVGLDSAQIRKHEPATFERLMSDIEGWLRTGAVALPATTCFPFERFAEAFAAIAERRATGKIVVTMPS